MTQIICKYFLLVAMVCNFFASSGQSILRTAEGKSGVLAGAQNNNDFADINYDRGSDEFSLNYRFAKQEEQIFPKSGIFESYPNFYSHNAQISFGTEDNKSPFIENDKWNANAGFSYTYSYTWDKTKPGILDTLTEINRKYYKAGGAKGYATKEQCEGETGEACFELGTTTKHFVSRDKRTGFVRQTTLFFRFGSYLDRLSTGILSNGNVDSIFVSIRDPLQFKTGFAVGFNIIRQLNKRIFLSMAISGNLDYLSASTNALQDATLLPVSHYYFNAEDSSQFYSVGTKQEISIGKTDTEVVFSPRIDTVLRYRIGEKKPYLGLISSVAPRFSSLAEVESKWNFSIGPSLSLYTLPDQILFALMFEWLQDDDGQHDFGLNFHVGVPFVFN